MYARFMVTTLRKPSDSWPATVIEICPVARFPILGQLRQFVPLGVAEAIVHHGNLQVAGNFFDRSAILPRFNVFCNQAVNIDRWL